MTNKSKKREIVGYDESWPQQYAEECEALAQIFNFPVHHFGSTSVPGLAAKAKIDLLVEVPFLSDIEQYSEQLTELGYEYRFETWTRRRFYAKRVDKCVPINVHIVEKDSFEGRQFLLFRDYLRAYKEAADQYAVVKQQAIEASKEVLQYQALKTDLIKDINYEALEWSTRKMMFPPSCYVGRNFSKNDIMRSLHHNICGQMGYGAFYSKRANIVFYNDGTLVVLSDIQSDMFNVVANADVQISVDDVIANFYTKNVPFSWYTCQLDCARDLLTKLKAASLHLGDKNIGMFLDLRNWQQTKDNKLDVRRVLNRENMQEFCNVLDYQPACDYYTSLPQRIYSPGYNYEFYIGYDNASHPVTACILFFHAGVAGIYYLYTKKNARNKGYATAMLHRLCNTYQGCELPSGGSMRRPRPRTYVHTPWIRGNL